LVWVGLVVLGGVLLFFLVQANNEQILYLGGAFGLS